MLKINTQIFIILILFLFSCTHSSKYLNCKDFKTGVFHYRQAQSGNSYKIFRNDTVQTEYNLTTAGTVRARIKWINDCEYELKYIDETATGKDTTAEYIKTHTLITKILKTVAGEVNGTRYNYCVFESSMFGVSQKLRDTLWADDTDAD